MERLEERVDPAGEVGEPEAPVGAGPPAHLERHVAAVFRPEQAQVHVRDGTPALVLRDDLQRHPGRDDHAEPLAGLDPSAPRPARSPGPRPGGRPASRGGAGSRTSRPPRSVSPGPARPRTSARGRAIGVRRPGYVTVVSFAPATGAPARVTTTPWRSRIRSTVPRSTGGGRSAASPSSGAAPVPRRTGASSRGLPAPRPSSATIGAPLSGSSPSRPARPGPSSHGRRREQRARQEDHQRHEDDGSGDASHGALRREGVYRRGPVAHSGAMWIVTSGVEASTPEARPTQREPSGRVTLAMIVAGVCERSSSRVCRP